VYGESVNKAGNDLPHSHLGRGSSCMGQYEGGSANAHSLSLQSVRLGVPPSGSAGCAPFGLRPLASIPDAFGRRWAPGLRAALAFSHACFCGGAGLLFPSSLHTVLAVKVCTPCGRWRLFGRLRTCDCCAAACRFRSRAIPPDHWSWSCNTICFLPSIPSRHSGAFVGGFLPSHVTLRCLPTKT
jgi:hypothetical protein